MKNIYTLLLCLGVANSIDPLVLTKNGLVRGVESQDGKIDSFLGIPYAEVDPNNPFGDSVDVAQFEDIYNATDDSVICPQQDDEDFTIIGVLDCLRVNVYVPEEASSDNLLPVMVWIHGGGFRRWNSNRNVYGPDFLVNKGVILVTLNYRLGPYGFMSLNRSDIPGNAGLRDQLKALQWIKENIAAFDGDDNNITLFGESAGAASVEFHIVSGYSEGLFHKAIMQSGTMFCDWVMLEPDVKAPLKLAQYLGLDTDDNDEALKYLSRFGPKDVINATLGIGYAESFKPSVEHDFPGIRAMIKDKPSHLLRKLSPSIPIIVGFNSRERQQNVHYYLQSPNDYFEATNKTFKAKISKYFNLNDEELETAEEIVRRFYIDEEDIGADTLNEMIEFDSDFTFVYPSLRSSKHHLNGNSSVYLYMFDYDGERNYMKNRLNLTSEPGAMHADEIGYLFHQSYYTQPNNLMDTVLINRMTTIWSDFAKTSNPTPRKTELVPLTWQASTASSLKYAVINEQLKMTQHPYVERMDFWDVFFATYGDKTRW